LSASLPGGERDALTRAWLTTAPLDLRVNTIKITREQAQGELEASGIESEQTPYSPLGLRVAGKPALQSHPLFTSVAIEVQDAGSAALGPPLAPPRRDIV